MSTYQPFSVRVLCILWPAFLMAGVLEALVFAVVDPATLTWFGGEPIAWSPLAIHSATFLMFWGVIATAGALTQLLINVPAAPAVETLLRPVHD